MENVLDGKELRRAQVTWLRNQQVVEQRWKDGNAVRRDGRTDLGFETYFDIPNLMNLDDVFIDLIDSPKLLPLLSTVCGRREGLEEHSSIEATGQHASRSFVLLWQL